MREKARNGVVQGVALAKGSGRAFGESGYQKYQSGKSAKNYSGQARSNAAKALKARGF